MAASRIDQTIGTQTVAAVAVGIALTNVIQNIMEAAVRLVAAVELATDRAFMVSDLFQ